jgi:hypothetical protein
MVSVLRNSFAMRSGELAHGGCSESRCVLKVATAIEPSGLLEGVVQFDSDDDVDVLAGTVEVEVDADDLVVTAAGLELLPHDAAPNADSVINTIPAARHTTTLIPGLCTSRDRLKNISQREQSTKRCDEALNRQPIGARIRTPERASCTGRRPARWRLAHLRSVATIEE